MSDCALWVTLWNQVIITKGDCSQAGRIKTCSGHRTATRCKKPLLLSFLNSRQKQTYKQKHLKYSSLQENFWFPLGEPHLVILLKTASWLWLLSFCVNAELFESLPPKLTQLQDQRPSSTTHYVTPSLEIFSGILCRYVRSLLKPLLTRSASFSF